MKPILFLLLCGALLSGCTTPSYKLYDGNQLPADKVARLEVPYQVDVLSINERERKVPVFALGAKQRIYELLPGTYTLSARYYTVYSTGDDSHASFRSDPVTFVLEARAGRTYRIAHDPVPEDPVKAGTDTRLDIRAEVVGDHSVNLNPGDPLPVPPVSPLAEAGSDYLSHHRSDKWRSTVSPEVMAAWKQHRSYYALVEILDSLINPWCNPATKDEVRKILGPPGEGQDAYPGLAANTWLYTSARKVPYGSYCFITFGEDDKVKSIEWASE